MSNDLTVWKMPDWMRQYEPLFREVGASSVETLMNTYGAKCANMLAQGEGEDVVRAKALMMNAQVGLMAALRGADLLKDVPPCPLKQNT